MGLTWYIVIGGWRFCMEVGVQILLSMAQGEDSHQSLQIGLNDVYGWLRINQTWFGRQARVSEVWNSRWHLVASLTTTWYMVQHFRDGHWLNISTWTYCISLKLSQTDNLERDRSLSFSRHCTHKDSHSDKATCSYVSQINKQCDLGRKGIDVFFSPPSAHRIFIVAISQCTRIKDKNFLCCKWCHQMKYFKKINNRWNIFGASVEHRLAAPNGMCQGNPASFTASYASQRHPTAVRPQRDPQTHRQTRRCDRPWCHKAVCEYILGRAIHGLIRISHNNQCKLNTLYYKNNHDSQLEAEVCFQLDFNKWSDLWPYSSLWMNSNRSLENNVLARQSHGRTLQTADACEKPSLDGSLLWWRDFPPFRSLSLSLFLWLLPPPLSPLPWKLLCKSNGNSLKRLLTNVTLNSLNTHIHTPTHKEKNNNAKVLEC